MRCDCLFVARGKDGGGVVVVCCVVICRETCVRVTDSLAGVEAGCVGIWVKHGQAGVWWLGV